MKLGTSWVGAALLAAAVFAAFSAVTFAFCNRSVDAYIDNAGKYVHAL